MQLQLWPQLWPFTFTLSKTHYVILLRNIFYFSARMTRRTRLKSMAKNLWNMFKIFEIIFSAWVMIMSHDKSAISLSIIAVPWFSQKSHFATHTWFSRFSYLQLKMISLCWLYSNCSYSINVKKSDFQGSLWPSARKRGNKNLFRYGGSVSQGFSRKCCYVRHNNHVFVSHANNWTNKPPKSSSTWI